MSHSATTHGASYTPEYTIWAAMKARCSNPNHKDYARYGGRGVKVCRRWQAFENFLADMGPRPSPGLTLERIDNSRGYSPANVRWATRLEQARNRSTVEKKWGTDLDGKRRKLACTEWADMFGMPRRIVSVRINRGWSLRDALQRPIRVYSKPEAPEPA